MANEAPVNQRLARTTMGLAWCSLAALLAGWLVIAGLGDRIWWALPFLYGPRWFPALALLGILPAVIVVPRRAVLLALAGAAVVLFGLFDFRLGLGRRLTEGRPTIRVMELNADGTSSDLARVLAVIQEYRPAIVVIAECGPKLHEALAVLTGYHFHSAITPLCLISRGAILEWNERDPQGDIWKEGGSGAIVRAIVATPAGPIRLGLVHLATPRNALDMYFDLSEIPKLGPITRTNAHQREKESGLATGWMKVAPSLPTIIAGDFNLPIESAIYRRHWSGYRNAFSQSGFGTGYTKHTRLVGVRIDHILSSEDVVPIRSFVGRDVGSDHLPLIADLVLPKR